MSKHKLYAVIIGSEILDKRREDAHFSFLSTLLQTKNLSLTACFYIKDDPELLKRTYELVLQDERSILFSFGGIGSTPDDLTRQLSCDIFSKGSLTLHKQFEKDIIERFGKNAYPHRIKMAMLPKEANLLHNPINNMSGYYLQERFFFMPGFPSMAHPMLEFIAENFLTQETFFEQKFFLSCSENAVITLLETLPKEIELSILPSFLNKKPVAELCLQTHCFITLENVIQQCTNYFKNHNIQYKTL